MLYFVFAIFTLYLQSSGFNQFSANVPPSGKIHYCDIDQHAIIIIIIFFAIAILIIIIVVLMIMIISMMMIITAEKSVSVTYPPRLADLLENSRHRIYKESSTISDTRSLEALRAPTSSSSSFAPSDAQTRRRSDTQTLRHSDTQTLRHSDTQTDRHLADRICFSRRLITNINTISETEMLRVCQNLLRNKRTKLSRVGFTSKTLDKKMLLVFSLNSKKKQQSLGFCFMASFIY